MHLEKRTQNPMDEPTFSRTEGMTACFMSCLPSCRLLPPGQQQAQDERVTRLLNDGARLDDREADLLSLHERSSVGSNNNVRRPRRRQAAGDVTGGGASEGSGLSRWTLFKSWWSGQGKIRLEDYEQGNDEDALSLRFDSNHDDGASDASSSLGSSTLGRKRSDRLHGRAAESRARELGLTLDAFENGEPATALRQPARQDSMLASPSPVARASRRSTKAPSTHRTDSRSSLTSSTRTRSEDGTSQTSASLHASTARSPNLNNGKQYADPSAVPLPASPSSSTAGTTASKREKPKRRSSKHKSQLSTSTNASSAVLSSSSATAARSPLALIQEPFATHHNVEGAANLTTASSYVYLPDVNGQLQTYLPVVYEGQHYLVDASGAYHPYSPVDHVHNENHLPL